MKWKDGYVPRRKTKGSETAKEKSEDGELIELASCSQVEGRYLVGSVTGHCDKRLKKTGVYVFINLHYIHSLYRKNV